MLALIMYLIWRIVQINDKLYALLLDYRDNWRDAYQSDLFFATKKTGLVSYSYVNATIGKAAKKASINKQVSCHILRHSFDSALVKNNVGLADLNEAVRFWLDTVCNVRLHQSTREIPTEAFIREKLKPINPEAFLLDNLESRKVMNDCTVSYEANFYSVLGRSSEKEKKEARKQAYKDSCERNEVEVKLVCLREITIR